MRRQRKSRPRVRLNPDAVWEHLSRRNMTQNELARAAGITSGHLSLLMNGKRSPSPRCQAAPAGSAWRHRLRRAFHHGGRLVSRHSFPPDHLCVDWTPVIENLPAWLEWIKAVTGYSDNTLGHLPGHRRTAGGPLAKRRRRARRSRDGRDRPPGGTHPRRPRQAAVPHRKAAGGSRPGGSARPW